MMEVFQGLQYTRSAKLQQDEGIKSELNLSLMSDHEAKSVLRSDISIRKLSLHV